MQLSRIDRVPAIVTRPVGDIGNLLSIALAVGSRGFAIEEFADFFNDGDIGLFVQPANIVGLAGSAFLQDEPDGGRVIFHIKPIANLHAIAVNGEGFLLESIEDNQRNQFLGKMIGPVIVGTVRRKCRQAIRVLVSAHEVITCRFRSGVRAIGLKIMLFGEGRCSEGQRAINFIRRDVEKAESAFFGGWQTVPMFLGVVEETQGTNNIGLDERLRRIDRTIDVGFGRKIHDRINGMGGQQAGDERIITNITVSEDVARITR